MRRDCGTGVVKLMNFGNKTEHYLSTTNTKTEHYLTTTTTITTTKTKTQPRRQPLKLQRTLGRATPHLLLRLQKSQLKL